MYIWTTLHHNMFEFALIVACHCKHIIGNVFLSSFHLLGITYVGVEPWLMSPNPWASINVVKFQIWKHFIVYALMDGVQSILWLVDPFILNSICSLFGFQIFQCDKCQCVVLWPSSFHNNSIWPSNSVDWQNTIHTIYYYRLTWVFLVTRVCDILVSANLLDDLRTYASLNQKHIIS